MRKFFKRLFVLLLIFACLVAGAWYLLRERDSQRLALLDAELSYVQHLDELMKVDGAQAAHGITVAFSADLVNQLLAGIVGAPIKIQQLPNSTLSFSSATTDFRDGFPQVTLRGAMADSRSRGAVDFRLIAVLQPVVETKNPSELILQIKPIQITPEIVIGRFHVKSPEFLNAALEVSVQQIEQTLPPIRLPLSSAFSVSSPPTSVPISIPTGAGSINATVSLPGFTVSRTIGITNVLLLSDGIHVTLTTEPETSQIYKTFQYSVPSSSGQQGNDFVEEVEKKIGQREALRSSLESKLAPLRLQPGDQVRVEVAPQVLASITDALNSLTDAQRTVHLQATSETGQLIRLGGGAPAGCGGYAELSGHNSLSANLGVSQLVPSLSDKGFSLTGEYKFSFDAQVVAHGNGPPGPRMELKCLDLGFAKPCTEVPVTLPTCDTPLGGGISLGSYGVSGNRTEAITALLALHSDSNHWLTYDLSVISPDSIPITVSIGLGALGTLGVPFTFQVPHQPLLTGSAPDIFGGTGTIESNSVLNFRRQYTVTISPSSSTVGPNGYIVRGKAAVSWSN
jgi:hypothetical protein